MSPPLKTTPLAPLHHRLGARMVPFAGWSMPVQYAGTLAEHEATRTTAGLFDVSHMAQVRLSGPGAAPALERLVPGDIAALAPMRQRYTMFTNEAGGILDDIMVANYGDRLELVVNAARAEADIAHLHGQLEAVPGVEIAVHEDRALLALQGPRAAAILSSLAPEAASLPFMGVSALNLAGAPCWASRSGYTGEDGFEISIPAAEAERVAEALIAAGAVPAGLAARDTLRLEAGLCLYGQDIDELTTPVEAGLTWSIGKRRRAALDFPGGAVIGDQLTHGVTRRRVGLRLDGRALARAGTEIVAHDDTVAGSVTSGGYAPSLGGPIAMGYVRRDLATEGTALGLSVRGQRLSARVVTLPFVPHRYAR